MWYKDKSFLNSGSVSVISVRGTFSLSSRLIARASCSCSSSSPLVAGRACSRSGASRGEEEEAVGKEDKKGRQKGFTKKMKAEECRQKY